MAGPADAPASCVRVEVLGIATTVEADDAALLHAAIAVLGGARTDTAAPVPVEAIGAVPRLVLRASAPRSSPPLDMPLAHGTAPDGRLLFAGAGALGRVDLDRCTAVGEVALPLQQDEVRFREVVHALVLVMLTRMDRQPVHAAAVALGDAGLLLAGPSGAGKSTLACAAGRAGLHVLSDDSVFVQLEPTPRVWAMPGPIFLTASAAAALPDCDGRSVVRANGKRKIAVRGSDSITVVERAGLCVLDRAGGAGGDPERTLRYAEAAGPVLEPISPDRAIALAGGAAEPGFDVFAGGIEARLRACTALGAWRLRLTDDAHAAVRLLRGVLQREAPR